MTKPPSNLDQRVDHEKYGANFDGIEWVRLQQSFGIPERILKSPPRHVTATEVQQCRTTSYANRAVKNVEVEDGD